MEHAEAGSLMLTWVGILSLIIFVVAYATIAMEEKLHINKSKPALFAGTFIFLLIGIYQFTHGGVPHSLHDTIHHLIFEIAAIFFFLYVAMTYIEALIERNVFEKLKVNLINKGYNYTKLFWVTGTLAFFLSPVADNLTTALILSTVLVTIEHHNKKFLVLGAINIVVAANAGGAWSPFGDITTLMVWAAGKGAFEEFLFLFPASIIGWGVTAFLLARYLPEGSPGGEGNAAHCEDVEIKKGGKVIIGLGVSTIVIAVLSHNLFHLPAFWGMMFGLSLLKLYSYNLKIKHNENINVFGSIAKIENDTLLFFFGLLAAVGGLSYIGYLAAAATVYESVNPTYVNIAIGLISAVVDNVPVMFAVLKANPVLDNAQWMLVTLTAGIGGSLIAFGSAAGVGVMGKLRGIYTFGSHMKYAWTIMIGYIVSILVWYVQFEVLGFHIK